MHIPMWHLRWTPYIVTIKLHHGGEFTKFPNVNYIEGTVTYVDMVDIEEFSIHKMDAIMKGLGYSVPPFIYYHFRVPKGDIDFGLRALGNDDDVLNLALYVKEHKLIRVYTKHDDEVHEGDENSVNKEVTEEENHDRNEMNDENVEMRDFVVDDGSEDNIETDEEKHERSDESEDSDDSDFWVDEDNIIPYVEVDMREFHMNIDLEVEFLEKRLSKHRENESDEVNEELDVIDNDQWDSLDEGSDIDRKRRAVIRELGKETRCSQGEIHKVESNPKIPIRPLQEQLQKDYQVRFSIHKSTNPETTVKLEFDSEPNLSATSRSFKRMVDSKNGIYPLAYVIVETENTDSWKWFLECIVDDMDLYANSNFTFISDRQKGLQAAISQLFPCVEHRFCLRHIHDNMRKTCRTNEYKEHLWNCATATTIPEFNHRMQQFNSYDIEAYNWLKQIPPQHWARSHLTGRAVSDMLLNNLCEVFNSKLIDGRDKPLITCLEYIREYMMKRICNVTKDSLVSIVIAVLNDKAYNGEEVGELHTYAHRVHWLETWKVSYVYKVEPIKGQAMWPISECPIKITPPLHKNQPGRPKKKKGDNVASGSGSQIHIASGSGKLTRKFIQVTCSKC
uniref:MULE transposase domain-containing protein n=1 Tax=Lactuca sativa TaxID=4236 RepID=A0A9R1VPC7_LACSA|nr:hypothetical protein LSAT_V11C500275290 [Lactuca sativa]